MVGMSTSLLVLLLCLLIAVLLALYLDRVEVKLRVVLRSSFPYLKVWSLKNNGRLKYLQILAFCTFFLLPVEKEEMQNGSIGQGRVVGPKDEASASALRRSEGETGYG